MIFWLVDTVACLVKGYDALCEWHALVNICLVELFPGSRQRSIEVTGTDRDSTLLTLSL
jgi:hypothetical protein